MTNRRLLVGLAAVGVLFPLCAMVPVSAAPPVTKTTSVIVRLSAGSDRAAIAQDVEKRGGQVSYTYRNVFSGFAAKLPDQALAALNRNPAVLSIERDASVAASDTQSGATWGLDRIDQAALPLDTTFTYPAVTSSVTSYVVDTGVLSSHAEFTGRTGVGYTAIGDGRGTTDCNGHGTHVAGTIAGTNYGVAKSATTVPVRVLDCTGSGSYSGVIAGLDWIVGDHVAGAPAVANLSLGGPASSTMDAAIQRVIDDGVTVVVAAGNSTTDACTASPARVPGALTIAASTSTDVQASYSNFGSCVDLFAPGSSIKSAWYTGTTATNIISGTSMASPHVAGAVALLLGQNPSLTPTQTAAMIIDQSTVGVLSNVGAGTTNRLLRVGTSTPPVATAPAAPTGVTAAPVRRGALVSWTQGDDGGSALKYQTVRIYVGTTLASSVQVPASATSYKVTGLKFGTTYTFRVSATNGVNLTSPLSAPSNAVVPRR